MPLSNYPLIQQCAKRWVFRGRERALKLYDETLVVKRQIDIIDTYIDVMVKHFSIMDMNTAIINPPCIFKKV